MTLSTRLNILCCNYNQLHVKSVSHVDVIFFSPPWPTGIRIVVECPSNILSDCTYVINNIPIIASGADNIINMLCLSPQYTNSQIF